MRHGPLKPWCAWKIRVHVVIVNWFIFFTFAGWGFALPRKTSSRYRQFRQLWNIFYTLSDQYMYTYRNLLPLSEEKSYVAMPGCCFSLRFSNKSDSKQSIKISWKIEYYFNQFKLTFWCFRVLVGLVIFVKNPHVRNINFRELSVPLSFLFELCSI